MELTIEDLPAAAEEIKSILAEGMMFDSSRVIFHQVNENGGVFFFQLNHDPIASRNFLKGILMTGKKVFSFSAYQALKGKDVSSQENSEKEAINDILQFTTVTQNWMAKSRLISKSEPCK